jgi:hypothetical protein
MWRQEELQHKWHELFQYNAELLQDADGEDWDPSKYRGKKDVEDL